MKRAILYTRVSTEEQKQESQQIELRAFCAGKGWQVIAEITDKMSGASAKREGLDRVLEMVKAREVDAVLVVKIDRLARSVLHFTRLVEQFEKYDVALVATSQGIDTSKENPASRLQMQVLASVAEFERSLISERTKAGLAVVKARGKQLGHPSTVLVANAAEVVREWHARTGGFGLRELRDLLGRPSLSTTAVYAKRYAPVA